MKTLKYTNANGALDVEYLVDLIGDNDMMTIYQICQYVDGVKQVGLNGTAVAFGMPDTIDQRVSKDEHGVLSHTKHTLTYAKYLAGVGNLNLQVLEDGEDTAVLNELDELEIETEAIDSGVSGFAQIEVLTFPTTAGATQGDYVVLANAFTGETLAAWLDIEENGTVPTGEIFEAADHKVVVPIVADGTAADTAAAFVDVLDGHPWAEDFDITDELNGTVTVEQLYTGVVDEAVLKNADDSGVGTITSSTSGLGTDGEEYEFEFEAAGGNEPYIWSTESDLPVGLTLSPEGVLAGVPREAGTFTLSVKVTDLFGVEEELEDEDLVITETE